MSIATAIPPAHAPSSTLFLGTTEDQSAPAAEQHPHHEGVAPKPVRLRAPRGGITLDGIHYRGGAFIPPTAAPALEDLAARAARRSTAEPVVIGIQGFSYRVEALPIDPSIGAHAFSVQDLDRARIYTVHRSAEGEVCCDCGDFTWRKAGTGQPCKHGRELVALGLIPTRPTVLPPFAQRDQQPLTTPLGCSRAAAVAGFERWAADRVAAKGLHQMETPASPAAKGIAAGNTPAESWRHRGERLGLSGRLVDLEQAHPDATARDRLLYGLDYSEGQHFGFRDFARQLGYAAGLDGVPGERPATIPRRFNDAWLAGFEAGDLERRERDRIMAGWQLDAQEEEMARWDREEAAEAGGWYRAALARA